jgi:IS30 family transposase
VEMKVKDAASSIKAFKLAEKYFPFQMSGVQTDNGSEFRGDFHKYLIRRKIVQRYIPKRSAPWNGKVERAN